MKHDNLSQAHQYMARVRERKWRDPDEPKAQEPTWKTLTLVSGAITKTCGTTDEARHDLESNSPMTSEEYGLWVQRWKSPGFLVDGCVMTNLQMGCSMHANRMEAARKYERGECCGEVPSETSGECPRLFGLCPLVRQAGRILHEETGE